MFASTRLLQAESLTRHYGKILAVDNLSLSLQKGEVLGLLGLNGAGKSTTLEMLSGVLAPESGWVSIAGHDIEQFPMQAKSNLGYLPANPPLYPELTVHQYLAYSARLHRISKAKHPGALERAINLCHLEEVSDRIIANLSKGFKQRVGIAQALIHSPQLLILDEPSSGLDPIQLMEIRHLIKSLAAHCGVILSSHILPEVTAICDRVAIIHHGRLIHEEQLISSRDGTIDRYFLRLKQHLCTSELSSLSCIRSAELLDNQGWHISVEKPDLDRIIEEIHQQGWQVLEFTAARNYLEERFASLTVGQDVTTTAAR